MSEMESNRAIQIHGTNDLENTVIHSIKKWKLSVYNLAENVAYEIRGFDGDRIFEANENSIKLFLVNYKSAKGLAKGNYIHISYMDLMYINMRIENVKLHSLNVDGHNIATLVVKLEGKPNIRFN